MKHVITNAAAITILEPIDNTYKTGGGPVSVGATVVVASKGKVGEVMQVLDSNWQDYLGKPLPKKKNNMEGLRHLSDATAECNYVNVVRVVSADAKFPALAFLFATDKGAWATATDYVIGDVVAHSNGTTSLRCITDHTSDTEPDAADPGVNWEIFTEYVETSALAYDTSVSLAESDLFMIYPVDGDPSVNRRVLIENVDTENQRFDVVIMDKDELGEEYELESYTVGIDSEDKDDMGAPAYIETVFENYSDRFMVDWNDDITWAMALESLQAVENTEGTPQGFTYVGGTNGSDPTTEEWIEAWDTFRNESIVVNLMFAAGNYDADVIANCADIADDRHCKFFADVPPYLQSSAAEQWLTDAGIKSRHTKMCYAPISASDPWRGGKTVWGVSGAQAAAKAIGNAIYTGVIPGIHFAPAGENRAYLDRTGIKLLFPKDVINRDDLYTARINPLVVSTAGGAYVDDDLVLNYKENYTRFGWVNDILDYIDHRFLQAAGYAKFEPDGLTRNILYNLTKEILDDLVTSGALVPPRNPTVDGTEPYVLTVTQKEIDLWYVQWDVCPTGAARRIAGQPRLIK